MRALLSEVTHKSYALQIQKLRDAAASKGKIKGKTKGKTKGTKRKSTSKSSDDEEAGECRLASAGRAALR